LERIRTHARRASAAHKQLALYARAEHRRLREMKHYLAAALWRPVPATRLVAAQVLSVAARALFLSRCNAPRRPQSGVVTRW